MLILSSEVTCVIHVCDSASLDWIIQQGTHSCCHGEPALPSPQVYLLDVGRPKEGSNQCFLWLMCISCYIAKGEGDEMHPSKDYFHQKCRSLTYQWRMHHWAQSDEKECRKEYALFNDEMNMIIIEFFCQRIAKFHRRGSLREEVMRREARANKV